jgi:hypothetical protein
VRPHQRSHQRRRFEATRARAPPQPHTPTSSPRRAPRFRLVDGTNHRERA